MIVLYCRLMGCFLLHAYFKAATYLVNHSITVTLPIVREGSLMFHRLHDHISYRGHTAPTKHFPRTHQIWPALTHIEVNCHITAVIVG